MQEFIIKHDNYYKDDSPYYIKITNSKFKSVTWFKLEGSYKMKVGEILDLMDTYKGLCRICGEGGTIYFVDHTSTKKFIDDFLIPHEIAYILNREIK